MAILKVAAEGHGLQRAFPDNWTHIAQSGSKKGQSVTTYHALELGGALEDRRKALVAASKALADQWEELEKAMLALVRPAVTLPVPEGHELVVSNRYGPQFYVAPISKATSKKGALKIG